MYYLLAFIGFVRYVLFVSLVHHVRNVPVTESHCMCPCGREAERDVQRISVFPVKYLSTYLSDLYQKFV